MAIKKVKEETVNDVVENVAKSKEKKKKSFVEYKKDMAEKEKKSVVVKSDDIEPLDLSGLTKKELDKKVAQLQKDHLLRGWNSQTKEALVISDEFAVKQAAKRAESDRIKEERDE